MTIEGTILFFAVILPALAAASLIAAVVYGSKQYLSYAVIFGVLFAAHFYKFY